MLALAADGMTLLVAEQNRILASHAHRVLQMSGGRLQTSSA
jgi:ABC-type ATPase involved in cell division